MPINVCDKNGRHIGVVHKRFLDEWNLCMVALTDVRAEELNVNVDKMKGYVATEFGCKKMFGKVEDEDLREKLYGLLESEDRSVVRYEQLVVAIFLRNFSDKKIEKLINEEVLENKIKGYILYDLKKLSFEQNSIVINEELEYINEQVEKDWDKTAIFAKITDYPIIHKRSYFVRDGTAHEYTTKVKILSGNFEDKIELDTMINCKKGMNISLIASKKKIIKVFCDDRIYIFEG
ncbi:hypothetical protein R9X47_21460 [Wukongibacter baidiensis]|uniref:hypothetical protein n=1 Tax=Wukongibacter baidiensis TaxID=1723361 RepID=UPI003D7F9F08